MKISIRIAIYLLCFGLIELSCVKETHYLPEEDSLKIISSISTIKTGDASILLQASFDKKRLDEISEFGFVLSKTPMVIDKDTITKPTNIIRVKIIKGYPGVDTFTIKKQLVYKMEIKKLEVGQTYYIRSFLRVGNNNRCGYSDEISIVTPQFADEITINNNTWKRNNLSTDKFRSGKLIYFANNKNAWDSICNIGKPAYCYYNFGTDGQYGKLYNYWAMKGDTLTGSGAVNFDEIAPSGWHVANSNEFATLEGLDQKLLITQNKWGGLVTADSTLGLSILPGIFYEKTNNKYATGFSNSSNDQTKEETAFWSDHSWNYGWESYKIIRTSDNFSKEKKYSETDELNLYLNVKNYAYYIRLIKN